MGSPALQFPGIDTAIGQFEGFGTAQAPSITKANNPGAIQAGQFATAHGATGALNNFAVFPDVATGTAAEDALVQSYANQGLTIDQMINKWAPATAPGNSPESTSNYVQSVANSVGANPNTPVSQLSGITGTTGSPSSGFLNPFSKNFLNPMSQMSGAWGRVGAFLLGLLLIVAALYLFKPPAAISVTPGPIGRGVNKLVGKGARAARAAVIA